MKTIPQPMAAEESTTAARQLDQATRAERPSAKRADGFTIPKGDFAHFMDTGRAGGAGVQTLKHAVRESMRDLGEGAMSRSSEFNRMLKKIDGAVYGDSSHLPESMRAIAQSMEHGMRSNMRYLELQYKYQFGSRSFSTISNVMKRRNESIKNSYNQIR